MSEAEQLRIYTNTAFIGHWPVGVAAVIVARNHEHAAGLLSDALERAGLSQKIDPASMQDVRTDGPHALILNNGDY